MFGFLRGARDNRAYRQIYAGCCGFQHAWMGLETLPLLSYEAVFLYLIAVDARRCARPDQAAVTCCRLRRSGDRLHAVDPEVARFCAAFGLLLARIKLDDDVRDDRSLLARFARWRLRSRFARAFQYFHSLEPGFEDRVRSHINRHLELEQSSTRLPMECYAEPTAAAFGHVFRLFHRVFDPPAPPTASSSSAPSVPAAVAPQWLEDLGRAIGRAIIGFDCAVDWESDRRRGRYNPLRDRHAVNASWEHSRRALCQAGWMCQDAFGPGSLAMSTIQSTLQRLAIRGAPGAAGDTASSRAVSFRRRRILRQRRGDCDCCCEGLAGCDGLPGCDCPVAHCDSPCDAGHGDGCAGCDGSRHGCLLECCPIDCCCVDECPGSKSKKNNAVSENSVSEEHTSSIIGTVGYTAGPLNPTGFVRVAEQQLPAKSETGEWIDGDVEVRIVSRQDFGVVVRPLPPARR